MDSEEFDGTYVPRKKFEQTVSTDPDAFIDQLLHYPPTTFSVYFHWDEQIRLRLAILARFPLLETLSLSNCFLNRSTWPLAILTQFRHLKKLCLPSNELSDVDVTWLDQMTSLQYIDLEHNHISDTTMIILAKLPHLYHVDVTWNQVTNRGILTLLQSPSIQYIYASRNRYRTTTQWDMRQQLLNHPTLLRCVFGYRDARASIGCPYFSEPFFENNKHLLATQLVALMIAFQRANPNNSSIIDIISCFRMFMMNHFVAKYSRDQLRDLFNLKWVRNHVTNVCM